MKNHNTTSENEPKLIAVGVLGVIATLTLGVSIAFLTGLVTPPKVLADIIAPPCCSILPPPPVIVQPAASVVNPMPPAPILGCTDPHATNYKSNATQEDGSCTYPPPPPPQPVWTSYCTGADDPHPWQIWAHDDSTPQNYKYVGTDPSCAPPPPPPPQPVWTSYCTGANDPHPWQIWAHDDSTPQNYKYIGADPSCAPPPSRPPPPPPTKPSCTLSSSPASVSTGGHSTLSWTTSDSVSFSIDHSIGQVTPVASGATSTPALSADTTFTGTATDASGNTAVCTASVAVSGGGGGGGGPTCTMTASPSSVPSGGLSTLTWGGSEISSVDIDNDIAIGTTSPGSTSVAPPGVGLHTYVGTFHASNGQTLTCTATVQVTGRSGGCASNCGGGGGSTPPTVTLASLPHIGPQPLAYLYLSQIPYTGLDLGPVGTAVYWLALVCVALAAAYLILFSAVPFVRRSMHTFAARVSGVLNAPALVPSAAVSAAPQVSSPAPKPYEKLPEAPRGYSSYDGFRSFAHNGALSIEDLVKGLSREHVTRVAARTEPVSVREADVASVQANVEPIFEHVETIQEDAPEGSLPSGASTDVRGFAAALVEGDRAGVFAGLRQYVRGGGAPERLVSSVACLVDDAYRARIDGSPCNAAMARLTARLDTPTLEKLVVALTTAIDSSYSDNVAGAKLALTRALTVLGA